MFVCCYMKVSLLLPLLLYLIMLFAIFFFLFLIITTSSSSLLKNHKKNILALCPGQLASSPPSSSWPPSSHSSSMPGSKEDFSDTCQVGDEKSNGQFRFKSLVFKFPYFKCFLFETMVRVTHYRDSITMLTPNMKLRQWWKWPVG